MKKLIYICDRCQKEIQDNIFYRIDYSVYKIQGLEEVEVPDQETDPEKDLMFCRECMQKIAVFAVKGDETPEIQAKSKHNRPALDYGKIVALRNAGWTLREIAIEFGVSEQTISNHLPKAYEAVKAKQ